MKHKLIFVLQFLLGAAILASLVACSRSSDSSSSLLLSIPMQNAKNETGKELEHVIINLRPGGVGLPLVRELEDHEIQSLYSNGYLQMVLDQNTLHQPLPKSSNLLVQYLGVFQGDNEDLEFSYGDVYVNTSGSGDIPADITAVSIGTSQKEARVMGRYFNSTTGGPTGKMIAYFHPPTGSPRVAVMKKEIYNGWFEIFILDNYQARFSYEMESGEPVFTEVHLGSPLFQVPSDHQLHLNYPVSYHFESNDMMVESVSEEEVIAGFFSSTAGPDLSNHKVCYVNTEEALKYSFADPALTQSLIFDADSTDASKVRILSGGVAESFVNVFSSNAACSFDSGSEMALFHNHLDHHGEDAFGIRGPFQIVEPLQQWEGFVKAHSVVGGNQIQVEWKYLPGVLGPAVSGATIFARYDEHGGGGGGGGPDDRDCAQELFEEGFAEVGDASGETFTFNGAPIGVVDSNNIHNWRLAVCPFRYEGGAKVYAMDSVHSSCVDGCSDFYHTGWGTASATVNGEDFNESGLGGDFGKVVAVDSSTYPEYTVLTLGSTTGNFQEGDEVLFYLTAEGQDACGVINGMDLSPGLVESSRLLYVSGPTLKVPKGSYLEAISSASLSASAFTADQSFCFVQAVRVPHFRDLTVGVSGLNANAFSFSSTGGGGILAFRVNGTLNIGGPLNASNSGFAGGTSGADNYGAGNRGDTGISSYGSTGSGGAPSGAGFPGAGGGGYGRGGNYSSTMGGQAQTNDYYGVHFFLGGGGGAGDGAGGNGGGLIYVMAEAINVTTAAQFSTNGNDGAGTPDYSGGGGGGSLYVRTRHLNLSATLDLQANGGNSSSGGGGGGGYIDFLACEASSTPTYSNSGGAGGVTPSYDGYDGNSTANGGSPPVQVGSSVYDHFCEDK